MYHRPVCVKCHFEMIPEENGVGLLDMASFGPYKIWEADKYKCPGCGHEVVVGFPSHGTDHSEDYFKLQIESHTKAGNLIKNYEHYPNPG